MNACLLMLRLFAVNGKACVKKLYLFLSTGGSWNSPLGLEVVDQHFRPPHSLILSFFSIRCRIQYAFRSTSRVEFEVQATQLDKIGSDNKAREALFFGT